METKIIFWGSGNVAREFMKRHLSFIQTVKVVGFTDSDEKKWQSCFIGYNIFPPDILLKQDFDYILILSSYFDEIKEILVEQYNVLPRKIMSIDDADQMYVRSVYGSKDGRKFVSRLLCAEFAFSEKIYDKMLEEMDNMFSYYFLKEKYMSFIKNAWKDFGHNDWEIEDIKHIEKKDTPIWICWLQGIENAPDIVKCCVNSIISNVEGKIHIIDYSNYSEYVSIEEYILNKHKSGVISKTHFSDILRLALLCKYGGVWMDATLFMMDAGLPDYIYKLPVFMYRLRRTMDMGYLDSRLFTTWFIKSEKNNPILNVLYKMIEEYWKVENENPYYIFHYFLRMVWDNYAIEKNYGYRLNIYDDGCRVLSGLMDKKYDKVLWTMIKETSPLQKLTYKDKWESKEGEKSFYDHILSTQLLCQ